MNWEMNPSEETNPDRISDRISIHKQDQGKKNEEVEKQTEPDECKEEVSMSMSTTGLLEPKDWLSLKMISVMWEGCRNISQQRQLGLGQSNPICSATGGFQ